MTPAFINYANLPADYTRVTYAKDQPQYLPLPVIKSKDGEVIIGWKLTLKERIRLLFTGQLYHRILTFNEPLQPTKLSIEKFEL